MNRWATWRAHLWRWAVPLAFCLLNLAVFTFYRVAYAGKVEVLQRGYQDQSRVLADLRRQRHEIETYLDRVSSSSTGVGTLYLHHFATAAQRLTSTLQQVKDLARAAGLDPSTINYPSQDLDDYDLQRQQITFSVEGSYQQLRQFINLLEITDHFVILEQVALSKSTSDTRNTTLGINLSLSTIFTNEALARRTERQVRLAAQRAAPTEDAAAPAAVHSDDADATADAGDGAADPSGAEDDPAADREDGVDARADGTPPPADSPEDAER